MVDVALCCPEAVSSILAVLHERTGADFSRYRPATVHRRILNRMISVGAASLECYLDMLRSSEDEAGHLLSRLSIKVSRFYRNRASYDLLRGGALQALAARAGSRKLRIWSAGCGCGEEPYTFAMLLDEAGLLGTIQATDIDPMALEAAEGGVYCAEAAAELPLELRARYLDPVNRGHRRLLAVRPEVRARVRFTRIDLLTGALPGDDGFHVVACRNVLIYLQESVRNGVFGTLRRALLPGGLLFLGEAEWPNEALAGSLEVLGRGVRIFRAREETPA